jgi:hypothetical protein
VVLTSYVNAHFSLAAIAVIDGSKVICYKWDSKGFIHGRSRGDISLISLLKIALGSLNLPSNGYR